MLIEVRVPQLSESVSEATLATWHKHVGDLVKRDENLADIETDKVVLEIPVPEAGVLVSITKGSGAPVSSGETIATIETDATATKAVPAGTPDDAPKVPERTMASVKISTPAKPASGSTVRATNAEVLPMPEAKSGAKAAAKPATKIASVPTAKHAGVTDNASALVDRPEQRVAMSRLRARIADRLVQSQQTTAMLTTFNEANMHPVIEIRTRYKEKFEQEHGVKLGFIPFFVKAVLAGLKEYPILNASVDGSDIIYHGYYDIGVAVSTSHGLVVPILRDADRLSIAAIERQVVDFSSRARDGKLDIEDLSGGTFTISNGGVFGSLLSTPIINPPQSAILGVHAIQERPIVEDGRIIARPMTYLALSYNHRIIDGREAVLFLVAVKNALEDPARLLLEI